MTNLNPLFTIREQLVDAVLYQRAQGRKVPGRWRGFLPSAKQLRKDAQDRAVELMRLTGIPMATSGSTTIRISSAAACGSAC